MSGRRFYVVPFSAMRACCALCRASGDHRTQAQYYQAGRKNSRVVRGGDCGAGRVQGISGQKRHVLPTCMQDDAGISWNYFVMGAT
jgi:hypothetical protein